MATSTSERPIPTGEGLTFEKVWAMFQETDRRLKKTEELVKDASANIHNLPKLYHAIL